MFQYFVIVNLLIQTRVQLCLGQFSLVQLFFCSIFLFKCACSGSTCSADLEGNNLSKYFPIGQKTILYPSAKSHGQWTKTVASQTIRVARGIDDTVQIAIYFEGRERGLTQEEIGRDVFHPYVELHSHGNGSSCCPHSYPFMTVKCDQIKQMCWGLPQPTQSPRLSLFFCLANIN